MNQETESLRRTPSSGPSSEGPGRSNQEPVDMDISDGESCQSGVISKSLDESDDQVIASEVKWASASERSKLYLTNGYLEKSCILETKHFGHMVLV